MIVRAGRCFFRHRNGFFPFAFLLVLLPGPRIFPNPLLAAAVGCAIAAVGQALRAATIGLCYVIRGGKARRVYAEDLVTQGLYGHCRNPMYSGNLLILAGVAVASNSWGCVATAVPMFLFVYVAIVAAEENYLRNTFNGQFERYVRETPRWLFRLHGLGGTLLKTRFHWRRVLVKEYGTPCGWIAGICSIALWNLHRIEPLDLNTLDSNTLAANRLVIVLLIVALLWTLIRVLKKSRRLVAD